jgi:hypothetical protein
LETRGKLLIMEHKKRRRVDDNCVAGSHFVYFCVDCRLRLYGYFNKQQSPSLTGWTWELTYEYSEDEIATSGNKYSQSYGGTETDAREDGLRRFDEEPCRRPN